MAIKYIIAQSNNCFSKNYNQGILPLQSPMLSNSLLNICHCPHKYWAREALKSQSQQQGNIVVSLLINNH